VLEKEYLGKNRSFRRDVILSFTKIIPKCKWGLTYGSHFYKERFDPCQSSDAGFLYEKFLVKSSSSYSKGFSGDLEGVRKNFGFR
jgi:hypothetical protein